jgi:hypothetical protein
VKPWRRLRAFACFCAVLFGALTGGIRNANAAAETFAYEGAVEYCRGNVARPIALSDDRRIMCFDGWITTGQDLSLVKNLQENGLFVVRSFGGSVRTAIALADVRATAGAGRVATPPPI